MRVDKWLHLAMFVVLCQSSLLHNCTHTLQTSSCQAQHVSIKHVTSDLCLTTYCYLPRMYEAACETLQITSLHVSCLHALLPVMHVSHST